MLDAVVIDVFIDNSIVVAVDVVVVIIVVA
jgi:hypothetical protein